MLSFFQKSGEEGIWTPDHLVPNQVSLALGGMKIYFHPPRNTKLDHFPNIDFWK